MPFPVQEPIPFTDEGVRSLVRDKIGCYGIIRHDALGRVVWVKIGRGDNRERLLRHLSDPVIMAEAPTKFVTIVTDRDEEEEKALIVEYRPILNQRVG